ncbi:hypothetical protein [Mangrovibrevibacter kandeliae]|uniref:hypothetical protein n=1 Tax=Mangrovibrevibacter kandeliae TaxID=2968473 RepID=UPI00211935B6|nr:hypothetical protein [Aurantimonas sp. CSK15Z-1]MCQ8782295.1 hypothetical protein [Aurantimonas sp. CSK15Z-1]
MSDPKAILDNRQENIQLSNGSLVPFQVVQDVYNEVTGKKETLSKNVSVNHQATMSDIIQLNNIIEQIFEQYAVQSSNVSVTVYHTDDRKEVFSSFDRFQLFDSTGICPIENVNIEYNFLMLLPKSRESKLYKISVHIHSRAAIIRKEGTDPAYMIIARFALSSTGRFSIEYVDYAVASTVYAAIDKWFEGLSVGPKSPVRNFFQRYSHLLPFIFSTITTACCGIPMIFLALQWSLSEIDLKHVAVWGLSSFLMITIASKTAWQVGRMTETSLDRIAPMSFLNINKGDKRVIKEVEAMNRSNVIWAFGGILITIILNVFSNYASSFIGLID